MKFQIHEEPEIQITERGNLSDELNPNFETQRDDYEKNEIIQEVDLSK